jgi:hypothetical protein
MMNIDGMGWMMTAGMGLIGVLVIVLLVLGIAALVKYLFFESRRNWTELLYEHLSGATGGNGGIDGCSDRSRCW